MFIEGASAAGIDFMHHNDRTPDKFLPETMGSGVLVFDFDADGWQDLLFVQSGRLRTAGAQDDASFNAHHLYRNNGDRTFSDTTEASGIESTGYGMGACSGDVDNDGLPDLFVTNFGPNALYRNLGDGRFNNITTEAGIAGSEWSSSCAFADIDNDGDLDLYVANYLNFTIENNRYCGTADVRIYCDPNVYDGVPDTLYRNDGTGRFSDVSREAGIDLANGKGLGVVFGDFDIDGWTDIYVANDLVANFLFHNKGDGTFEETGLLAGVAVGGDGRPMSGMGTDMGDANGDGLPEVFVTNMDRETHNLYENMGDGLFFEVTYESGVGQATLPYVGWGTAFLDYDNDTDLDLVIANGAVLDNIGYFRDSSYAQRNLLLTNDGTGRYEDAGSAPGSGFSIEKVSRGLAASDLDNDGDLDIVVANNGDTPDLLWNDSDRVHNALIVQARGQEANRSGVGAMVRVTTGEQIMVREVRAGGSYLGHGDARAHFGLGTAGLIDRVEIVWPGGDVEVFQQVPVNVIVTVEQNRGIVTERPLTGR
jgi:hypothetical protein